MTQKDYEVFWPGGKKTQADIQYGPRLKSLAGKRIAELWNGAFRGAEIFPVIEQEFSRRYPGIEFVNYQTFGLIHGTDERKVLAGLPEKLKKYKCDAAIVTSGC
jgi:hypothetical protein